MSPILKAILIPVAAYALTLGGIAFLGFGYMVVSEPKGCAALGRALMGLWALLGLGALGSTAAVAALLWRLEIGKALKAVFGVVYFVVIVSTCALLALMLTVGFNC